MFNSRVLQKNFPTDARGTKIAIRNFFFMLVSLKKCHASISDLRTAVIQGIAFRVKNQLTVVAPCLRFIFKKKKKTETEKRTTKTKTHNLSMACDRRLMKDKLPKIKRRKKAKQVIA